MKLVINTFLALLLSNYTIGQRNLTKAEILKYWKETNQEKTSIDSISIVNSEAGLNIYLHKLVDSLKSINIDSILVFSTAYPGYVGKRDCITGLFPIKTFVIWNVGGKANIKRIEGNCSFDIKQVQSNNFFDFYGDNYQKMKDELIMPIILSGKVEKDKTISYLMSSVDHEPNYSFYYSIRDNCKSSHFTESDIQNKESLFHDHNLSLAIFHWWQIVRTQLGELN